MSSWGSSLERAAKRFRIRSAEEIDAATLALVADAEAASKLRAYQRNPNVAALGIERSRDRLDRWGWLFIVLGLLFTTVNVALFILDEPVDPEKGHTWYQIAVAAVVEPMVAGLLLVLLRGEQIAGRYGFKTGRWARNTRWTTLAFTYVMNTGIYWANLDLRGIFIHSVPVVLVFLAAEALTQQRETLTAVAAHLADVKSGAPDFTSAPEIAGALHLVPVVTPEPEFPVGGSGVPEAPQGPEPVPVVPQAPVPAQEQEGRLGRPKGATRLAIEAAYAELRKRTPAEAIRPVMVDEQAGAPKGTAKKVFADLVKQYEQEVNTGVDTTVSV